MKGTMSRFHAALVLLFLLAGCPSPSATVAPASVGGGSGSGGGGSENPTPEFASHTDVLAPKSDSEHLSEDLFVVEAYAGEGFSQRLQEDSSFGILMSPEGRIELPLRILIALRSDGKGGFEWRDNDPGLQVRLLHGRVAEDGRKVYRYCDALTTAPAPDGRNALFTSLDVREGGWIQVFLVNPSTPAHTLNLGPTADFSPEWKDLPDGEYFNFTRTLMTLGNIHPMMALSQEMADPGFKVIPEEPIYILVPEPSPDSPIDRSRLPKIPADAKLLPPKWLTP